MNAIKSLIRYTKELLQKKNAFERALPEIFEEIDQQISQVMGYATGQQVTEIIVTSISKATGKRATVKQVQTIILLYSPIVAAIKSFRASR
jgi:hypothetical protein